MKCSYFMMNVKSETEGRRRRRQTSPWRKILKSTDAIISWININRSCSCVLPVPFHICCLGLRWVWTYSHGHGFGWCGALPGELLQQRCLLCMWPVSEPERRCRAAEPKTAAPGQVIPSWFGGPRGRADSCWQRSRLYRRGRVIWGEFRTDEGYSRTTQLSKPKSKQRL